MPEAPHRRVQALLEEAVRRPGGARNRFLRRSCGSDALLLKEVLSLLPHYERPETAASDSAAAQALPSSLPAALAEVCARNAALALAFAGEPPPSHIGRYKVLEVLGCGGMGIVYRGVHATLARDFAVKMLRQEFLTPRGRRRFAAEIETLRGLQVPGVVRFVHAHETHTTSGPRPYFVMEYVDGCPITDYAESRELGALQRLILLGQVCRIVDQIHRRNVVHCDLKPANVLIDGTGLPRLVDFGIARALDGPTSLTEDEDLQCDDRCAPGRRRFTGTFDYASPEQIQGRWRSVTARSDVHALGLIGHELFVGTLPLPRTGGLRPALRRAAIDDDAIPHCAVDEFAFFLASILARALCRGPGRRHSSAGRLAEDIERLISHVAGLPRATGWGRRLAGLIHPCRAQSSRASSERLRAALHTTIAVACESGFL